MSFLSDFGLLVTLLTLYGLGLQSRVHRTWIGVEPLDKISRYARYRPTCETNAIRHRHFTQPAPYFDIKATL